MNEMMRWSIAELEGFFSCQAVLMPACDWGDVYEFYTAGPLLRYYFHVCPEEQYVALCGNQSLAFAPDSIYEMTAPCDRIRVVSDAGSMTQSVLCYYRTEREPLNRTLTMNQRDDGDLSVWPHVRYPPGHPITKRQGPVPDDRASP